MDPMVFMAVVFAIPFVIVLVAALGIAFRD